MRNGSAGVDITISSGGGVVYNICLPDHRLPSECGKQNVYCRQNLVISVAPWSVRIFIPLSGAFGVVDITRNDTVSDFAVEHHVVSINRQCSPVTFFKMLHSVFAVCLNFQTDYFNILSINVDTLQVQYVFPQPQYQISLQTPLQISNFIVRDIPDSSAPSDQVLYLTSGSYLYRILPLTTTSDEIGTLPDCTIPYILMHSEDGSTLLASCGDTMVYFDLQEWQILNITTVTANGYQYICQGANARLIALPLMNQTVELNINWWDSEAISSLLLNTDFPYLGVCFGHGSQISFAFVNETGVFLSNISHAGIRTASLYVSQCTGNQQYDRLEVFFEEYLLVHQECMGRSSSVVIDTKSMSVQTTSDNLLVLFQLAVPLPQPTSAVTTAPFSSNSTQSYPTLSNSVGRQKNIALILSASIIPSLMIGFVVFGTAAVIIWFVVSLDF